MRNLAPVTEDLDIPRKQDIAVASGNCNVHNYGAVGDGSTNDSPAFTAAIAAGGVVFVPAGTYYLATPIEFTANGQGLVGAGEGVTILKCATGAVKRATASAGLLYCQVADLAIIPNAKTSHTNSQEYANYTAIDFSGISYSTIRNVRIDSHQTGINLDYVSGKQTYYNHIENVYIWGGATGIYLGANATAGVDGSNANRIISCAVIAAGTAIRVLGGINSVTALKIENPSQAAGYPLTSVGIEIDADHYAIGNVFLDTYCELIGTGNKGIYFEGGGSYCSGNQIIGGYFNVNGTDETPTYTTAGNAYAQTVYADGIRGGRLRLTTPSGNGRQLSIDDTGDLVVGNSSGTRVFEALQKTGGTMTGAVIAADHGTATTAQMVNVCYGTGDPPTVSTTTEGTLFIKYTA